MKLNRIVFTGRDRVEVDTIDADLSLAPDQVLVRTTMTMVSQGTEMAALRGTHTRSNIAEPPAWLRYPSVPGYLQVGEIVEIGKAVTGFAVGERVLAEGDGCWNSHVGFIRHKADPRWLIKVPKNVPDDCAVVGKLASVAMHGVRTVEPVIGETCAVIGLGVIGQLVSRLCVLAGLTPVVASDPVAERRAIASKHPGILAVTPDELGAAVPEGYERIVEASGSPRGFLAACQLTRRLGRISVVSAPHIPVELKLYEHIMSKSLQVVGAHGSSMTADPTPADRWTERRQKEFYLKLCAEGRLDPRPFLTHRFAWDQAPKVYADLIARPTDFLGVLITW